MKYCKHYESKISKYRKDYHLTYKLYKKKIKFIQNNFIEEIESLNFCIINDIDEYRLSRCCICHEELDMRNKAIQIGCCENLIHYMCFIRSVIQSNRSCPLCRTKLQDILQKEKNTFGRQILQLLSSLIINIENIDNAYKQSNSKIKELSIITTLAILKILKKIDKKLEINIKKSFVEYFLINKKFYREGIQYII